MTDILPPAGWPNVRQLETNEFATGGANGNMNEQARSLAARSELLKKYAALPYESKTGGYALNERIQLATGDIVRSTIANNLNNPNENMNGWVKTNDASQIVSAGGETQQTINDFGGAKWWNKGGGYDLNARVVLENGDIVKSIVANNIINPNVDMVGWIFESSTITPFHFGAVGNGLSHKLSERYATLEQAKAVYPHAVSLDDEIDWCAITAILEKIKTFDIEIYSASKIVLTGNWQINKPLFFKTNGFTPNNFIVPTIEMNCKLLLDNFTSGQECVVFVGGSAFNFIGNLDFDVAKKAKHGLMSTNSEYLGTNYFPKCTNLPRCYINNAVMFNVFLENSMFATLPQYRGQGGGSGSLFYKDTTTISGNVISESGSLESNSVLTVAKLPDIAIDANEWVIVKIGEYYSIAKSAVGNAITVQPHIPTSAGTDLLYIYGGGVFTGGGDGAGIRIESLSSLDAVGLQHRALYSCNVDYMCTEFTAVSFRDDGVVGGANINLAYYEGDGAQYIRATRYQGFGGSNIANATGLEVNKFHDLSSGRDANGLPLSLLGTLQGMRVNIKGLSYKSDVEKRANNVIPNADIIDFNKPQHTSSILSNSRSLGIANVDEKYNELFGFDAQSVVVVGTGLNGAPTAVGFIPPADGKYKVNGSTSEVIFKDFASAAVFECIVDFTNKNILISLVSRAASTQSPVPSSVTNTADLPINSFVFFDSLIAGMPIPIVSTSTISNIKTEYSWGSSGRANRLKQVLEFPESQEVWTRSNPSNEGVWGAWSLMSYKVSKGATASRPSNPQLGVTYYDTTLLSSGKPISWNGAGWVDALGVAV